MADDQLRRAERAYRQSGLLADADRLCSTHMRATGEPHALMVDARVLLLRVLRERALDVRTHLAAYSWAFGIPRALLAQDRTPSEAWLLEAQLISRRLMARPAPWSFMRPDTL